jgi:hypothetical protein
MPVCGQSLFGSNNNYIKVGNGQFMSVEGSNTSERLILSDLRIPYDQIFKGKFTINPNQEDFALTCSYDTFIVTFLAIKVIYNPKSVIEEDNYLNWSYKKTKDNKYYIGKMLVLTGNSINKVPDILITNPSSKYDVTIEVMMGMLKSDLIVNETLDLYLTSQSISELSLNKLKIETDDNFDEYVEFTLVPENDEQIEKQRFSINSTIPISGIKIDVSIFGWQWVSGSMSSSLDWFYDNFDIEVDEDRQGNTLYVYNGPKVGERKIRLYINAD